VTKRRSRPPPLVTTSMESRAAGNAHAPIPHRSHRLELVLAAEPPSYRGPPPVPPKHLHSVSVKPAAAQTSPPGSSLPGKRALHGQPCRWEVACYQRSAISKIECSGRHGPHSAQRGRLREVEMRSASFPVRIQEQPPCLGCGICPLLHAWKTVSIQAMDQASFAPEFDATSFQHHFIQVCQRSTFSTEITNLGVLRVSFVIVTKDRIGFHFAYMAPDGLSTLGQLTHCQTGRRTRVRSGSMATCTAMSCARS